MACLLAGITNSFLRNFSCSCHNLSPNLISELPVLTFFSVFRCSKNCLCRCGHIQCSRNKINVNTLQKQWKTRKTIYGFCSSCSHNSPSSTFCSQLIGLQLFCQRLTYALISQQSQSHLHPVTPQRPCSTLNLAPSAHRDFSNFKVILTTLWDSWRTCQVTVPVLPARKSLPTFSSRS